MKIFIVLISLVFGVNIYAQTQEEQLKTHDWYVYKVVIDEEEYFPLVNEENENTVNLSFDQDALILMFCGELCGTIGDESIITISEDEFQFEQLICFGTGCANYDNYDFSYRYFEIWNYDENGYQYSYVINDVDETTKELIVTKLSNGNKAYYYSAYLSSESYIFEEAKIYPNPVQSIINVELPASEYQHVLFNLYDITGKKLKIFTRQWQENISLDIEEIPAGSYLLELNLPENTGRGYVVKLIKE